MLAALLAGAMVGCGGDDGASDDPVSRVPEEGGLQENVRAASEPDASGFPSAEGKSLNELAEEIKGGGSTEVGLATSVFTVGEDRLAFGMIDDQGQFVYGPTAVYMAPTPDEPAAGPVRGARRRADHRGALPLAAGGRGERPVRRRLPGAT